MSTTPAITITDAGDGYALVAAYLDGAWVTDQVHDSTSAVDDWASAKGYTVDRTTPEYVGSGVRYALIPTPTADGEPYVLIHQPRGEDGWEAVEVAVHAPDATFPTVGYLKDSSAAVEAWLADLGWEADRTRQERNGTITRFPLTRTAKAAADDLLAKAQANVKAAEVALAEAKATLALVEHAVRATR